MYLNSTAAFVISDAAVICNLIPARATSGFGTSFNNPVFVIHKFDLYLLVIVLTKY